MGEGRAWSAEKSERSGAAGLSEKHPVSTGPAFGRLCEQLSEELGPRAACWLTVSVPSSQTHGTGGRDPQSPGSWPRSVPVCLVPLRYGLGTGPGLLLDLLILDTWLLHASSYV